MKLRPRTKTTHATHFANPRLAEIAGSFRMRAGKGFRRSLVKELFAVLVVLIGIPVLFIVMVILIIIWLLLGIRYVPWMFTDSYKFVFVFCMFCLFNIWFRLVSGWFFYFRRNAKKDRIDARSDLGERSESPVLYLRSFEDDKQNNPESWDQKTYEEDLTLALSTAGPVIAIGKPKERGVPLGASRIYLKGADWKEEVKQLMRISQLIIIQAGNSGGLLFELHAALEFIEPRKVFMSFLKWRHLETNEREQEYNIFKTHVEKFFEETPSIINIKLPETIDDADFLVFEEDWTPRKVSMSRWKRQFYRFSSALSVTETIRPVLEERGFKLNRWWKMLYSILIIWAVVGSIEYVFRLFGLPVSKNLWLGILQEYILDYGGIITFSWMIPSLLIYVFGRLRQFLRKPKRKKRRAQIFPANNKKLSD